MEERFTQPAGFVFAPVAAPSGGMRVGYYPHEKARAIIVVAPGLSEFIEKYFYVCRDLHAAGFAVAVLDWRGQGLSYRHGGRADLRRADFDSDIADFPKVVAAARQELGADLPVAILAHSMGGAITFRHLADHAGEYVAAGVTSPLCGLPVPQKLGSLLARVASGLPSDAVVFGRNESARVLVEKHHDFLSLDKAHNDMHVAWLKSNPQLEMGRLTYGWVDGAFKLVKPFQDAAFAGRIATPVLAGVGGRDKVVSLPAMRQFLRALPQVQIMDFPTARHEILMERPDIRNSYIRAFVSLVDSRLPIRAQCTP